MKAGIFVAVALAFAGAASAATVETVDASGAQLFIHGSGFGTSKAPVVALGGTALAVASYSTTDIVATLTGQPPGSYHVVVTSYTSPAAHSTAQFDATIGAVGPAGPQGAPGAQGAEGPQGPQGPPGPMPTGFGANTNTALGGATGRTCTLGEIILQAGPLANGYVANGQYLNRDQEPALFALIGTTYGDDPNNAGYLFRLPNLTAVTPNGLTYSICARGIFPSGP